MRRLLFTEHALEAMERRQLAVTTVTTVARWPEQLVPLRPGRVIAQSISELGAPARVYLVRVVLDVRDDRAEVVTAYRTTRIARYWRGIS
ncbi:MAG: hypothetical protein IT179_06800 [Acidobacteria bacterium]|nr:hypothetical protein [Acidobacteriota bacterium]